MSNSEGDDILDEPAALELPPVGETSEEVVEDGDEDEDDGASLLDEAFAVRADGLTASRDDAEPQLAEPFLDTMAEEPSVLGDETDGPMTDSEHDGLDVTSRDPSFLGAEEPEANVDDGDLDDQLPAGEDDGGAEGVRDPEGEALDELPPLDGHSDEDEATDEAFAPELAYMPS